MGLKDRIAVDNLEQVVTDSGEKHTVALYRRKLLEEVDLNELATLSHSQRRARLERVVGHILTREGPVLTSAERSSMIRRIVDESLGLGVLEPLINDESITEIMVNGPADIWIERDGRLEKVDARFADEHQLYLTIDRIVSAVNRRVDESSPMVDARLPSGERVNVIIPPLALTGPTLTIRRFPRAYSLKELMDLGAMDDSIASLISSFVRAKFNIIVSGGTGTGKTTLLNALSEFIPEGERIVTIEDSAELQLKQPHVISLESRPPNVEAKGEITIRDLVRNSLRMRPDRILVGEVRGAETLDMLQAMNTGHEGSVATLHANSTEDAIVRLSTLASMSDLNVPYDALRDQINSAIDVIVQLTRTVDGQRKVAEIAVVASQRREKFRLATVAGFKPDPIGPDRRTTGRFAHFPLPDAVRQRLQLSGEEIAREFTEAAEAPVAPEREAV
ncbi:MAG: CpaF family protein [Actinobacteria bacterium]|nr:CpaF family protein [Actinomycetota bacterium]